MKSATGWLPRIALPMVIAWVIHSGLTQLGKTARAILVQEAPFESVLHFGLAALSYMGVVVGVWLWKRRRRTTADRALFWLLMVGYFAVGYGLHLNYGHIHTERVSFGGVFTNPARGSLTESSPNLPTITYRFNQWGFNGPDWDERPKPGVLRGVVIGDSFVFGYGVERKDALSVQLQRSLAAARPGKQFEVLNLGVKGISFPMCLWRGAPCEKTWIRSKAWTLETHQHSFSPMISPTTP